MAEDSPSRTEIYDAIDRLERNLHQYLTQGFEGINKRMDIANGRTTKNEEKISEHATQIGILLDRSNQSIVTARQEAKKIAQAELDPIHAKVSRIKWWITGIAGAIYAIVELVQKAGVF